MVKAISGVPSPPPPGERGGGLSEAGCSAAVDLSKRLRHYFYRNSLKRNNSMLICRALLKHGYSNFSLEILEFCTASKLLKREKYYFKLLNPEYNISQEPGSSFLGRKHSDETRAKMSYTHKRTPKP
jgi:group I intron endonuclease